MAGNWANMFSRRTWEASEDGRVASQWDTQHRLMQCLGVPPTTYKAPTEMVVVAQGPECRSSLYQVGRKLTPLRAHVKHDAPPLQQTEETFSWALAWVLLQGLECGSVWSATTTNLEVMTTPVAPRSGDTFVPRVSRRRREQPPRDPIKAANEKSDALFIAEFLRPR